MRSDQTGNVCFRFLYVQSDPRSSIGGDLLKTNIINVMKIHFTKNIQSHARKILKQYFFLADDWMMEVSRASSPLIKQWENALVK